MKDKKKEKVGLEDRKVDTVTEKGKMKKLVVAWDLLFLEFSLSQCSLFITLDMQMLPLRGFICANESCSYSNTWNMNRGTRAL